MAAGDWCSGLNLIPSFARLARGFPFSGSYSETTGGAQLLLPPPRILPCYSSFFSETRIDLSLFIANFFRTLVIAFQAGDMDE